nr:MAG TPA: hypothetical protein [Caudoviricetes sp.]
MLWENRLRGLGEVGDEVGFRGGWGIGFVE